jgi:hypothetical protein
VPDRTLARAFILSCLVPWIALASGEEAVGEVVGPPTGVGSESVGKEPPAGKGGEPRITDAVTEEVQERVSLTADQRYEQRLVAWALELYGREPDPHPEGKRIEEILIASENVVAPTDPWPRILNALHVKTKERVIRRELLVEVGETYQPELVEESERNLRKFFILAVVRIIPVKGRSPDTTALLVVTKDLWSLRTNTEFQTVGSLLQYLRVRPTEQNFLGLNMQLALDFTLRLDTLSAGQYFTDPRLFGTRLSFSETAAVIFNRHTGSAEGSRGSFSFGQPLYSLATEHGFSIAGSWLVQTTRIYQGASILQLPFSDPSDPNTSVPAVYDSKQVVAGGSYTRSFGRLFKTNVSGGVGGYASRYTAPLNLGLTDAQRAWLTDRFLPRTENALYFSASVRTYRAEFRVLRDVTTFSLSEDYQVGHSIVFGLRWANPLLFSPTRFLEAGVSGRYRWYFSDDLLTATVAAAARYFPGGPENFPSLVNRRLAAELVNYTPVIGIGRFAFRGLVYARWNDLNKGFVLLGGGNGLRGVPPEVYSGDNLLLFNFEYRTKPFELYTLHTGAVLFYDVGKAFGGPFANSVPLPVAHTFGIGIRMLFPQFNIDTFRIDFGVVLQGPQPNGFIDRFSTGFGQIFDVRPDFIDSPI